jgi:hypothetical protein
VGAARLHTTAAAGPRCPGWAWLDPTCPPPRPAPSRRAGLLLPEAEASELQLDLLRANASGTMVAALALRRGDLRRDARLFVRCTSGGGALHVHDFGAQGLLPVAVAWDLEDLRLLVVQTQVGPKVQGSHAVPCAPRALG